MTLSHQAAEALIPLLDKLLSTPPERLPTITKITSQIALIIAEVTGCDEPKKIHIDFPPLPEVKYAPLEWNPPQPGLYRVTEDGWHRLPEG